ncbi:DEAD/DEAH box helicase family protein [Streptomyces sp. ODS28]|uniref:DEAD/DEAH box helicase family protein n=1 Tax=Streptomyces sp. ODS28 TaxID=3136688 RepID=UPI0031E90C8C
MSRSTHPMALLRPPHPLRVHQDAALAGLAGAVAEGRRRAWVVLPPGLGKTLTGLEAARRRGDPVVVFCPNTAIQGQWLREWRAFTDAGGAEGTVPAGTDRALSSPVTVLTYQSLASFDPDAEVAEDGGRAEQKEEKAVRHLHRLRPQGRELVDSLRQLGRCTLLLDECHHLLDTWGELLAELLRELPEATVIGLTATPPDRLTPAQAALVEELFGPAVRGPSIPAAVREGHLAPYAELCWLTAPTAAEADWLAAEAERFTELTTGLLDPGFAAHPFLSWLDERIVRRSSGPGPESGSALPWPKLEREKPELAAAALRFHHAGLLALPEGARPREEHRHAPEAADWVVLLDDWVRNCLRHSGDPRDAAAEQAVRAALPGVGYQLTARGVRSSRSPVDRVLARSAAKTDAVREILHAEEAALGDGLRAVVLCDHERATATLPARLGEVLDAQAGSSLLVLAELCADPRTASLAPLLVTGRTVAAAPGTAERFADFCRESDPALSLTTGTAEAEGLVTVISAGSSGPGSGNGRWTSRRWTALATRFFESGGSRALVGTRGMLGEGWDARRVNTLVDLTEATTATAVVQTRGRALRQDPGRPEKVAHTWSVVCVADGHPRGHGDWARFVRKHDGYLGLTDAGEIMAGVSHVHPELSPYAPPPREEFDRFNAAMLHRAAARSRVRERWRISAPYEDELAHTLRVTLPRTRTGVRREAPPAAPPPAVPAERGVLPARFPPGPALQAAGVGAVCGAAPGALAAPSWPLIVLTAALPAAGAYASARTVAARRHLRRAGEAPVLLGIAYAVADGLHAAGLVERGADAVSCAPDETGAYRVELTGVPAASSRLFATALDEAVSPVGTPRYVLPRYLLAAPGLRTAALALVRRPVRNPVVHHAVPTALGENRRLADLYAAAWHTHVSAGAPLFTRSPEGAGVLAAQSGASPLEATTAMRVVWR